MPDGPDLRVYDGDRERVAAALSAHYADPHARHADRHARHADRHARHADRLSR